VRIGSLPRVGALDQLRGANGEDGIFERVRSNPRMVIAIAAGAVLLLAWIGWAIYVTSSNGTTAGLGVVVAWPAMLAVLALISLPFIGGYLLIRRLSPSDGEASTAVADTETSDDEEENEDSEESTNDEEPAEEEEEDENEEESDEDDEESESDSEPEASKAG
jgi:hypothetical protein